MKKTAIMKCSNKDCCSNGDFCMCQNPGVIQFNIRMDQKYLEQIHNLNNKMFYLALSGAEILKLIISSALSLKESELISLLKSTQKHQ